MANADSKEPLIDRLLHDPAALSWLTEQLEARPTAVEHVQTLWSGYGEIVRVFLDNGELDSVIVKWVEPPESLEHPRGWAGRASHERKLRSYDVERAFYASWSPRCLTSHRVPSCYVAEATVAGWRFLLEDLDASGYPGRSARLGQRQLDQCLRWLASFHARFLGQVPTGLWETGTYWHLATRGDELQATTDPSLREAAPLLDAALNECRFQTILHGDAKTANFCFSDDQVAAVDFQYAGGGCGMKDVAYFMSSCLTDAQCEAQAPALLDSYFSSLREHLDPCVDADALEREWRALYPSAWTDFHRFLAGWAPGHWKIHRYTREMTRQALASL
jgi:hypothetical protein